MDEEMKESIPLVKDGLYAYSVLSSTRSCSFFGSAIDTCLLPYTSIPIPSRHL